LYEVAGDGNRLAFSSSILAAWCEETSSNPPGEPAHTLEHAPPKPVSKAAASTPKPPAVKLGSRATQRYAAQLLHDLVRKEMESQGDKWAGLNRAQAGAALSAAKFTTKGLRNEALRAATDPAVGGALVERDGLLFESGDPLAAAVEDAPTDVRAVGGDGGDGGDASLSVVREAIDASSSNAHSEQSDDDEAREVTATADEVAPSDPAPPLSETPNEEPAPVAKLSDHESHGRFQRSQVPDAPGGDPIAEETRQRLRNTLLTTVRQFVAERGDSIAAGTLESTLVPALYRALTGEPADHHAAVEVRANESAAARKVNDSRRAHGAVRTIESYDKEELEPIDYAWEH